MNSDERIIFEKTEFDYVNSKALVVLVGITPGNSQRQGAREGLSSKEIKRRNAFAGKMRNPLIKMLDYIGVNSILSIASCKSLWEDDFSKVEMTSLLKDATYEITKDGKKEMFKNVSRIRRSPKLQEKFNDGFVTDCKSYSNAKLFVACGPGVYDMLLWLKEEGVISTPVVGIAHPSGANAGRISCYLGEKEPIDSSYTWCLERAEEAKCIIKDIVKQQATV